MSGGNKKGDASGGRAAAKRFEPVGVIDGVPDRSAKPSPWKYLALAAAFLVWVGFLVLCGIIGTL
jgi:uncharacterized membrane-anchored protein